jgi:hypothetical protein
MFVILVAWILFTTVSVANAASIVVESGFLAASVRTDFEPTFSLSAQDFSITGGAAAPTSFQSSGGLAGQPYNLSSSFRISSDSRSCQLCRMFENALPFELQFEGDTFKQQTRPGPPQPPLYSGLFEFQSILPSTAVGQNTAPFIFSGTLISDDFIIGLLGSGTVTETFAGNGSFLDPQSLRYDFSTVPLHMPEPNTAMLLTTGLLLLAGRKAFKKVMPL